MKLSTKQLEEITKLASLMIRPYDIAVFIEADAVDFIMELDDKESEIFKAHRRGYLETLIKNRNNLLLMSESSPEANIVIANLIDEYEALAETDKNNI